MEQSCGMTVLMCVYTHACEVLGVTLIRIVKGRTTWLESSCCALMGHPSPLHMHAFMVLHTKRLSFPAQKYHKKTSLTFLL